MATVAYRHVHQDLSLRIDRHGHALSATLAGRAIQGLSKGDLRQLRELVLKATLEPEVVYAAVVGSDDPNTPLAAHFEAPWGAHRDEILRAHLDNLTVDVDQDELRHFSSAVYAPRPDGAAPGEPILLGYVLVGLSKDGMHASLRVLFIEVLGTLLIIGFLFFFAVSEGVLRWVVVPRLGELQAAGRRMAEFDLLWRLAPRAEDEMGDLAAALNVIGANMREGIGQLQAVSRSLADVSGQVERSSQQVSGGVDQTRASVHQTSGAMGEMLGQLEGLARAVAELSSNAQRASSGVIAMGQTNTEVARSMEELGDAVAGTGQEIQQMAGRSNEVAEKVEALARVAETTSENMEAMDKSIFEVEQNAEGAAGLAEQVSVDAEQAAGALRRTLGGIQAIQRSSREVAGGVEALVEKTGAIGGIVSLIQEVSEQTNLLALNAAIIAAQAGEHGRSFGVVAGEIKDLAGRTNAATREIDTLIRDISVHSRAAIAAADQGNRAVEEGVSIADEAEAALAQITTSAGRANERVRAIASAAADQVRSSREVTAAIAQIATTAAEIAQATGAQAAGAVHIQSSAQAMTRISAQVERAVRAQSERSAELMANIEAIATKVGGLSASERVQRGGAEQVMSGVREIEAAMELQAGAVDDLRRSVESLAAQAALLQAEAQRFKV